MKTHNENMTSSQKKQANRQSDTAYLNQLTQFIELNYSKLLGYSKYVCRSGSPDPEELLHELVCDLYDGTRTKIDFSRSPLTAIQDMLRSKRVGLLANKKYQFDSGFTIVETVYDDADKELLDQGEAMNTDRKFRSFLQSRAIRVDEEEAVCYQPEYNDDARVIPRLLSHLPRSQRQYVKWRLAGLSLDEIVAKKGGTVFRETVKVELIKAAKTMRKEAKALFQADLASDQAHRQ